MEHSASRSLPGSWLAICTRTGGEEPAEGADSAATRDRRGTVVQACSHAVAAIYRPASVERSSQPVAALLMDAGAARASAREPPGACSSSRAGTPAPYRRALAQRRLRASHRTREATPLIRVPGRWVGFRGVRLAKRAGSPRGSLIRWLVGPVASLRACGHPTATMTSREPSRNLGGRRRTGTGLSQPLVKVRGVGSGGAANASGRGVRGGGVEARPIVAGRVLVAQPSRRARIRDGPQAAQDLDGHRVRERDDFGEQVLGAGHGERG